jgi:flap endonuclease-1
MTIHQRTPVRSAEKASKASKEVAESSGEEADGGSDGEPASSPKPKKKKPKGSGGVHVPDEWPWEQAKKVFEEPDVLPNEQIQVR